MKSLASCFLLGGCLVGGSTGTSNTNIIGGTDDPGDPAVGLVRLFGADGSVSACTGTLIAPQVMLTAGHCAEGIAYDVSFSAQPDVNAAFGGGDYITAQVIANPAYDGNSADGYDVSVVLLTGAPQLAPIGLGATPAQGASVRAVGYGMNVFGNDGTGVGTRRTIDVPVYAVATHEIVTGSEGATTCHGDSGGPLFDTSGRIVATTSYGDTADCHGSGHDMRIDDNLDFINQFIGGGGGGGNTCDVSQNDLEIKCTNGACICYSGGQQYATCTATNPGSACSNGNCCGF